jgi:hypothetical protein
VLANITRPKAHLQVGILFVGKRHVGGGFHLLLVLFEDSLVDLNFWWSKGGCGDKFERLVANKLAGEPARDGLVRLTFRRRHETYRKGFSKL